MLHSLHIWKSFEPIIPTLYLLFCTAESYFFLTVQHIPKWARVNEGDFSPRHGFWFILNKPTPPSPMPRLKPKPLPT